jgi:hypothetical protein
VATRAFDRSPNDGTGDPHRITSVPDTAGLSKRSIRVAKVVCISKWRGPRLQSTFVRLSLANSGKVSKDLVHKGDIGLESDSVPDLLDLVFSSFLLVLLASEHL